MKHSLIVAILLCSFVYAQPTVNGVGSDGDYLSLATWTQVNTGFGDHGIKELKGYNDGTNLYVMVIGEIESNFNELYIFVNHSGANDGLAAGTQLPAGSDGSSPFNQFRPTLDFEVDYGIRMSSGNGPANAYVSIINYRASGNTDTYIGGPANDGTVQTVSSGAYTGTQFAYKHMGAMSSVTNEGFEMKIPLSVIGATGSSTFELFALYGADKFISANTLPEIAGQSGTNLGNDPVFQSAYGTEHTSASTLPVELTSFTAVAKGRGVELAWKTATELNNKGFEIQRMELNHRNIGSLNQSGDESMNQWHGIGFIAGNGTTNAPKSYTFVDNSASGTVSYRLKQVDNDGSFEYSSVVEVTVAAPAQYTLSQNHPNPFNPATTVSYSLPAAGFVTLKVYDMLGKEVATLVNGMQNAGSQKASFDASQLPSGIYFARLSSGSFSSVIKMTLMK